MRLNTFLAEEWLQKNDYPTSDLIPLQSSTHTFEGGGGQYGIEVPVVNTPATLEKLIVELKKEDLPVTRFNETHGAMLLTDQEIKDMLSLCHENGYGMVFSLGPRPEYDPKAAFYRSQFGLEQCRKLNNHDAIKYSLEEALRLVELGCKGIIVYDIGVLKLLQQMKAQKVIPSDVMFKTSSHCMAANPMIAQIFYELGANSITVLHDVGLPVLQEMRRLSPHLVLDMPIDTYAAKGGFVRFMELPNIIQVAAPVILKVGAGAQGHPYDTIGENVIVKRVKRVALAMQHLTSQNETYTLISSSSPHCCIPSKR